LSRSQRLLDLIQILRRHRFPVTGAAMANELGVSLRTLYRDIDTLQQQGARIDAEPGLGFILRPGFMLPPLMFSDDEIEALILGSRWVAQRGDARLGAAAGNALAKITAVLPAEMRDAELDSSLLAGPGAPLSPGELALPLIRQAIRAEHKLVIDYQDLKGATSSRTIWPFALGFFDHVRMVVAWCEVRADFRHFRADRIRALSVAEQRYPRRRQALLKAWRASQQNAPQ
jgi:predicted DNA-binding transcriptional regulator YafY